MTVGLHVEVSLGKILNPNCTRCVSHWWVNVYVCREHQYVEKWAVWMCECDSSVKAPWVVKKTRKALYKWENEVWRWRAKSWNVWVVSGSFGLNGNFWDRAEASADIWKATASVEATEVVVWNILNVSESFPLPEPQNTSRGDPDRPGSPWRRSCEISDLALLPPGGPEGEKHPENKLLRSGWKPRKCPDDWSVC